jgi:hypothetical protein
LIFRKKFLEEKCWIQIRIGSIRIHNPVQYFTSRDCGHYTFFSVSLLFLFHQWTDVKYSYIPGTGISTITETNWKFQHVFLPVPILLIICQLKSFHSGESCSCKNMKSNFLPSTMTCFVVLHKMGNNDFTVMLPFFELQIVYFCKPQNKTVRSLIQNVVSWCR